MYNLWPPSLEFEELEAKGQKILYIIPEVWHFQIQNSLLDTDEHLLKYID